MVFHSVFYFFFILLFTLVLRQTPGGSRQWFCLSLASTFFYWLGGLEQTLLLYGLALVHYLLALAQTRFPKKACLWTAILITVGVLFSFKWLSGSDRAVLPIGLSFYSFQAMSYSIDVYRGKLAPVRSFLKFFSYLSFFPQLVAGPICRAQEIMGQLDKKLQATPAQVVSGLVLIFQGLFKKMVLADNLALRLNPIFASSTVRDDPLYWWAVMTAYGFQLYFDFSGYTDIARGSGKMVGLHLPENFDRPYLSSNVRFFWRRWHQTLSFWFRDYVYIPLGGSHQAIGWQAIALFVTFLLSGAWHGGSANFVLWGAYHGVLVLAVKGMPSLPRGLGIVLTYLLVTLGWVFFRIEEFDQMTSVLHQMLRFDLFSLAKWKRVSDLFLWTILGFGLDTLFAQRSKMSMNSIMWYGAILIPLIFFFQGRSEDFIYFRF